MRVPKRPIFSPLPGTNEENPGNASNIQPAGTVEWTGQQRGGVAGHWIFHQLLRWIGRDTAGVFLPPVVYYFTLTAPAGVRASRDFFSQAARYWGRPTQPSPYGHFLSFSQVLLDRAALFSGAGGEFKFSFDGEQYIRDAVNQGKGLLMLSAHIGNWEAAGRALHDRIPATMAVAMVKAEADQLAAFLDQKQQRRYSVIALEADGASSLDLLTSLRRGEIVAMHGDRFLPRGPGRMPVDYLFCPAYRPTGVSVESFSSRGFASRASGAGTGNSGRHAAVRQPPGRDREGQPGTMV
jgi:predicted LPLAT superfamily acyltransferase